MNTRSVAILVAVLLASHLIVNAQDDNKTYLNEVLAATTKKSAKYYRVNEGPSNELFVGRTYSIEGKLKSEGTYFDKELRVEHGLFTFYHENGSIESRGDYVMGNKSGVWARFDRAGVPLAEKVYNHVPLENIIYTRAQTMPKHTHGSDKDFIRYIKASVTPARGKRVKATMTTTFVVEKNGTLSDVKVVNGPNAEVDLQVVQAIKATEPWQPGMDNGQPVRVIVRIPVQF